MIREPQPRLVTGEILAADHGRPDVTGPDRGGDFEDAVFETVTAGASAPRANPETPGKASAGVSRAQPADGGEAAGLNVLRSTGKDSGSGFVQHFREAGGPLFWGMALVLVASAFWIAGGHALLARGGETPGQALVISDVQTRFDASATPAVIWLDATVENCGARDHRVPVVIVEVEAGDGSSSRFRLSSRADNLAPGARHLFSGRIPALTNGANSVSVKLGYGDNS